MQTGKIPPSSPEVVFHPSWQPRHASHRVLVNNQVFLPPLCWCSLFSLRWHSLSSARNAATPPGAPPSLRPRLSLFLPTLSHSLICGEMASWTSQSSFCLRERECREIGESWPAAISPESRVATFFPRWARSCWANKPLRHHLACKCVAGGPNRAPLHRSNHTAPCPHTNAAWPTTGHRPRDAAELARASAPGPPRALPAAACWGRPLESRGRRRDLAISAAHRDWDSEREREESASTNREKREERCWLTLLLTRT